ncbi:MAG: PKD domain-containing protein [Bacteroidia bacterium]
MKNLNSIRLILLIVFVGAVLWPVAGHSQLSGSYTINPNQAASSSNYQTWASAVGDLMSGSRADLGTAQGPGVSGAVVITAYDTIYGNTQISIGAISGASATNTITFRSAGGDSTACRLQFASSGSATDDYVLQLDGADHVTFQQIGFERTGNLTYSTVIEITNDADHNTFLRCWMKGYKMPSNTTLGFQYGIGSCIFFTGNGDSNQIIQNKMIYGYNGVYSFQSSTGNLIKDNVFDTIGCVGVYMTQQSGLNILNNTFNMGDFGTGQGHYVSYAIRLETSSSFLIKNNIIRMLAVNGLVVRGIVLVTNTSTQQAPAQVINNFITCMGEQQDNTGLSIYGADYINLYFNNVLITGSLATGAAYFHHPTYPSTHVKIINNNLVNTGSGYVYSITSSTAASDFDTINFNNVYSAGSKFANWLGTDYTSFANFKSGSSRDLQSLNVDPGYKSTTDLHASNYAIKEKARPYSSVPTDIDGDLRHPTKPDIGADEFPFPQNDASIVAITRPVSGSCEGLLQVAAVIRNLGLDTLKSATINWYVAGTAQTSVNWNGSLLRTESDTVVLGNYPFTTRVNIAARSLLPNGEVDSVPGNDSLVVSPQIFALPSANAGADTAICLGDSIQLGTSGTGASYRWLDLTNNVLGTNGQLTVMPAAKTSYILELTSSSTGCVDQDTVEIDVNPVPSADAGIDQGICWGDSVQIGTAMQTGNSYLWTSIPAGFSSGDAMPFVAPTVTTEYILEQSFPTGCSSFDTVTVNVFPLPTPGISGPDSICEGSTVSYNASPAAGSTYSWSVTGGQVISGQNTDTITVAWPASGPGSIMLTETNMNSCMDSISRTITINPNPEAKMAIDGSCAGRDISFVDTSANVQSRLWRFGDGSTATGATETHTYTSAGSYLVDLIVTNSFGCMDSMQQTLVVIDAPIADFSVTGTICEGDNVAFTNSSTHSNSYLWTFTSGQTSMQENPSFVFNTAGNYDVSLVAYGTGCNDSISKEITVNPLPDAGFTADVSGRDVSFVPNSTTGATYSWDFGDGEVSSEISPTHSYDDAMGWKTVSLTVTSQEGCIASFTDSVFLDIVGIKGQLPVSVSSLSIMPNPFREHTMIELDLAKAATVQVSLYDMQGRNIMTFINGHREAGKLQVEVDSEELKLNAGVYLLRIIVDGSPVSRQIVNID